MAIKKEDIKEGFYWVRHKLDPLVIVQVESILGAMWISYYGSDSSDDIEAVDHLDFIARIEPPEGCDG